MLYVMICEDKPDSQALRLATRAAHLAFIDTQRERVRMAGPMLSDDGERMLGSLFIVEGASLEDVRAMNAADPYMQAGLFHNVTIRPFRQVVPAP
jgi:uncharacterized protein YciI